MIYARRIIFILFLYIVKTYVLGANILGVFPVPSRSHFILGSALLKGMVQRGHNVTMLSPFSLDYPPANYTDVVIDIQKIRRSYESQVMQSSWYQIKIINTYSGLTKISETVLEDDNVQKFIKSDSKFDVIIYVGTFMESLQGLSFKFNASTILYTPFGVNHMMAFGAGLSLPSAFVPNIVSDNGGEMNFWKRLNNFFLNTLGDLYISLYNEPRQRKLLKKYFPDAPSLESVRESVDLFLINSHIAIDSIRPSFQNMINIGGYYLQNNTNANNLPEEIKEFLDNATNGCILFSFGSNIGSSYFTPSMVKVFTNTFAKLPYNILWKFDQNLPNISSNVKILEWLPQVEILSHPNVKLLIGHGGKGSINEAIYNGVPMLVIPFYMDQLMQAEEIAHGGIAIKINFEDVSETTLTKAINELLSNPKFLTNVRQRSSLFKHQEIHPMDKAAYWIEYVSRNKGAPFFKTTATTLPIYKLLLLDVIAFIMFVSTLVIVIAFCVFKYLLKFIIKHKLFQNNYKDKTL